MTAYYWYKTPALAQKQSGGSSYSFDYQNGWGEQAGEDADYMSWMWRRRGQGFDIVSYQGQSGTYSPMGVPHNLAQPPEMLWIKDRDNSTEWAVGSDGMTDWNKYMKLNATDEVYSQGELIKLSKNCDGILTSIVDKIDTLVGFFVIPSFFCKFSCEDT